ncbi:MAG: SRPBCC family protein [Acidimicrobiales bacterium]
MKSTRSVNYLEAPAAELRARQAATALRNRLRVNAAFSWATGTIALVLGGPLADLFDLDEVWLVRLLGGGLLAFGLGVFALSGARTTVLTTWSAGISLADFGWVVGTVVVLALGWLSTAGAVVMSVVGAVVGGLGSAQLAARRRLHDAADDTTAALDEFPPVEIHTFQRAIGGTPAQLWPIVSDHSRYAELALNLKAAENLTPNGPGFERSCTDRAGRTWSETCTLWDQGRRFDVSVNIDDYPYPLQSVQGSWRVDPHDETTSTVGMVFAIQPKPGITGRLFTAVTHVLFPPILKRIAKGWEVAHRSVPTDGVGR